MLVVDDWATKNRLYNINPLKGLWCPSRGRDTLESSPRCVIEEICALMAVACDIKFFAG